VRRWQRTTQLVGVVVAVAGLALASATTAGASPLQDASAHRAASGAAHDLGQPGAPTITLARWNTMTQIVVFYSAAPAGRSATTNYQVRATSLGDGSFGPVMVKTGPILEAALTMPSWTPDWSIRVRARDAAGWGSWSKAVVVGGL
jgi:uncharacterized protein (DUF58 family)